MVKNISEFENLLNKETLDIIIKHHKIFTKDLSLDITFNIKTKKFNVPNYYEIMKNSNLALQKKLLRKEL
jgi:hypothetical protein